MDKQQALNRLTSLENEAKELRKIIETPEAPTKPTAEEYLMDILSQCTGKAYKNKIVWNIGEQWVFEQDLKNERLWCYSYKVWKVLETDYTLNYQQIQALQRNVVGEALNCRSFTPAEK